MGILKKEMNAMTLRALLPGLLLITLLVGASVLRATDPADAALLTNEEVTLLPDAPPHPAVPASAIEPAPGSKLSEDLAKLAKTNNRSGEELAPLIEKFPNYSPSRTEFQGTLRITGSDSLGTLLVRAAGSYKSIYPNAVIEIRQGGSMKGLQELQSGNCEMAAVSRDLSAEEVARIEQATGRQVFTIPVALGAVCVYVNADNPIKGLTKAQCNGIFSMEHSMTAAPIIRWKQLDPSSPLGSAAAPLYMENKLSGTLQVFRDWCMPGENFTTINRFIEPGPSSVVNACCAYPAAIGIAGFAHRQPRAKELPLAATAGGPYVAPSIATIRNGTYPMKQRMNLVLLVPSAERIPPMARDFLKFLLSQDGQELVVKNGLIPIDPANIAGFVR